MSCAPPQRDQRDGLPRQGELERERTGLRSLPAGRRDRLELRRPLQRGELLGCWPRRRAHALPGFKRVAVVAVDPVVLHQHGASLGGKTAEAEIDSSVRPRQVIDSADRH